MPTRPDGSGERPADAREKRAVAAVSVAAAVFLTSTKLLVGTVSGSLGILSEAAHSGLDLVAAVVTLLAVRASAKPADREHTYGHGKVENLSALFEAALLFATCTWIIVEAIERLFFKTVHVEASAWAFAIMAMSIAVDLWRSRALRRVAVKYDSRALEADALHFSTDIWSSAVVIVGLAGVAAARAPGLAWLADADAVAALGVAAIVVWITVQLGRKTVADLLDAIPPGLRDEIDRVVRVPGVVDVVRVRVRRSGADAFADVTLTVGPGTAIDRAHLIATSAEAAIRRLVPGADVVVHVEPADAPVPPEDELPSESVRGVAARLGFAVHDIHLHHVLDSRSLELHLEVDKSLSVAEAHQRATTLEAALRAEIAGLAQIVTHIEPQDESAGASRAAPEDEGQVLAVLRELASGAGMHCHPHDVMVRRADGGLTVSFHCALDAGTAITAAHELTERFERELRARLPHVGRVVIHVEPLARDS
ncbi:MAG TPA: cation-efflux pump [Thermoanaerobaculaceae bacterium]|nr:cation-efflux pump [Thermoanaerobaculaceae bacterium]